MLNKSLIQPENGNGEIINMLNVSSIRCDEDMKNYVSSELRRDPIWYIIFYFNGVSVSWRYKSEQKRNIDLNLIMRKFGVTLDEWK